MTTTQASIFKLIDMSAGPNACWKYKQVLGRDGRPYVQVDGKKHLVYRLVYDLTHDEPLGERMAMHQCDNAWCCNGLNHIKPGTHKENMAEMISRERHGQSAVVVKAIRKLALNGRTHEEIAELYGIGRSTVTEIVTGANYSHVVDDAQQDNNTT